MATGDVRNPDRVRFDINERLDQVDGDALSQSALLQGDGLTRGLLATPKATPGAPTGLIMTGGSLTANPTGPSDGLVRLNTETFVALDADDRMLVKPAGTTLQMAVPGGGGAQQLYAYFVESEAALAVRRFISSSSPYTESASPTDTRYASSVGLYIHSGGTGSILQEAVIGGATVPLVFLGLVSNTAGTVTVDTSATTNRLSTIDAAPTAPSGPASNGSMATLQDMVKALAYMVSRDRWKGSTASHQPGGAAAGASNNFHAYDEPAVGLDATYRKTLGIVTIGDGSSQYGDFDRTDYPSDDTALLTAALAALPTAGGTIALKPGVTLNSFTGDVSLPSGKHVRIVGCGHSSPISLGSHKLLRVSYEDLVLENLDITTTGRIAVTYNGRIVAENCYFTMSGSATAMFYADEGLSTFCNGWYFRNCTFAGTAPAQSTTAVAFIDTAGLPTSNFKIDNCLFTLTTNSEVMVAVLDARQNVEINDSFFTFDTDLSTGTVPAAVRLNSTVNTPISANRQVQGCGFRGAATTAGGPALSGLSIEGGIGDVAVSSCWFDACYIGVSIVSGGQTGYRISNSSFNNRGGTGVSHGIMVSGSADVTNLLITACEFFNTGLQVLNTGLVAQSVVSDCLLLDSIFGFYTTALKSLTVKDCGFVASTTNIDAPTVSVLGTSGGIMTGCRWINNFITGYGFTADDAHVVGVSFYGLIIEGLLIADNTFYNLNNVGSYSGTSSNGVSVVSVTASFVVGLTVSRNRFHRIMYAIGTGGTVPYAGKLVYFNSIGGGNIWADTQVESNVFGDTQYPGITHALVSDVGCVYDSFKFCRNTIAMQYPGSANFQYGGDVSIYCDALLTHHGFNFRDNTFYCLTASGSPIAFDCINVSTAVANTATLYSVNITDNVFRITQQGRVYGITFDAAFGSDPKIANLIVKHNTAIQDNLSYSTPDTTTFKLSHGTVTRSLPALPGSGAAFADNFSVREA